MSYFVQSDVKQRTTETPQTACNPQYQGNILWVFYVFPIQQIHIALPLNLIYFKSRADMT